MAKHAKSGRNWLELSNHQFPGRTSYGHYSRRRRTLDCHWDW